MVRVPSIRQEILVVRAEVKPIMTPEVRDEALRRAQLISENREVRYEWRSLNELEINPLYQRDPTDPQFVKRFNDIVVTFNAALFKALDVAAWQGHLFVWDGQCRLAAALERRTLGKARPGDEVMCAIIEASPEEQADLFVLQEHRRNVLWADKHRANLVGSVHREVAEAVQSVFDDLGLTLGREGDVRAVQACYSTVEIDRRQNVNAPLRPDLLKRILIIANNAWYDPISPETTGIHRQYATSDRMIDALALLLTRFSPADIPDDDLAKVLGLHDPAWFVNQSARKTSAHGSNNKTELAWTIVQLYNKTFGVKFHQARLTGKKKVKKQRQPMSPEARAKLANNLVKARAARAQNLKASRGA